MTSEHDSDSDLIPRINRKVIITKEFQSLRVTDEVLKELRDLYDSEPKPHYIPVLSGDTTMAKYLETAAEANKLAIDLFERVTFGATDDVKQQVAADIARLVNYGMRCCPRPAQSTVRLRAVQRSVQGLPVKVTMEEHTDERTGRTYNRLVTAPK